MNVDYLVWAILKRVLDHFNNTKYRKIHSYLKNIYINFIERNYYLNIIPKKES